MAYEKDGVTQYSKDELKSILREQSATVIDVRTEEEYAAGHIPGVPLKPMQELLDWMTELNPEAPYVFVCRSGNRSQKVATYLKQNGFSNVGNFDGGMLAWDGDLEH
ncbi:rhodanese-like protein [Alicyclobacillus contaminans]|uniref:rhodanese-like domain-containing protein n=1 Tax=Alicyclobacillus contaminans TaxID=392016 RepID=UPI00041C7C65|nr:rhodanese-like domain-containing protein [Alicyclobacillus contaminans]GMA52495.1 rhodanese-like protein [Alicyclobacillus contaminans]